eukprot:scaffold15589_cov248-Alexandrium_tamarense.AAC.2
MPYGVHRYPSTHVNKHDFNSLTFLLQQAIHQYDVTLLHLHNHQQQQLQQHQGASFTNQYSAQEAKDSADPNTISYRDRDKLPYEFDTFHGVQLSQAVQSFLVSHLECGLPQTTC